jgi:hypothetical protein
LVALVHLWVASYARAALILAIALAIGYPVSRRVVKGVCGPLIALVAGLALLTLIVCVLCWARIFDRASITAVGVVAGALSVACLRTDLPRWRGARRFRARFGIGIGLGTGAALAVVGLALIAYSVLVLYPSTAFDATSYHLPLARDLVQRHGLIYDPFVRYSFFPQPNEAMFAVMQLLSPNPVSAAALEYSVLALSVLLAFVWFLGSGRTAAGGLVAGLVLLASPVVILAGTTAYVDTWAMTFVLGGLVCGLEVAEGRWRPVGGLALAGMLLGEAAATKYLGLGFAAAAAVAILIAARSPSLLGWSGLAAAAAGFLAIAAPWYAWTIHTTGDPLYPLATSVFGNRSGLWTRAEIKSQTVFDIPSLGAGLRRDLDFLLGRIPYDTGHHRSPLSWWLGLGFLGLLVPRVRRQRTFLALIAAGVLGIAFWAVLSVNPRYLVPGIGPLALTAGLLAEWTLVALARLADGPRFPRLPRVLGDARLAPLWCLAAAAAILWSSSRYERGFIRGNGTPPTSQARIASYLSARIPCYAAVGWLNSRFGVHYRAWGYQCEQARYYAAGRLLGDAFSTGSRLRVFDEGGTVLPGDRTLWLRLEPLRVRWVILPASAISAPAALGAHGLFALAGRAGTMAIFELRAANPTCARSRSCAGGRQRRHRISRRGR